MAALYLYLLGHEAAVYMYVRSTRVAVAQTLAIRRPTLVARACGHCDCSGDVLIVMCVCRHVQAVYMYKYIITCDLPGPGLYMAYQLTTT